MPVGGSVIGVSINGRHFSAASDADAGRMLGGSTNEVESNGDGTARILKTTMPWSMEGLNVSIDDDNGDAEFLQDVSDGNVFVPMLFTFAAGNDYSGEGQLTGDFPTQNAAQTAAISVKGTGKLSKQ